MSATREVDLDMAESSHAINSAGVTFGIILWIYLSLCGMAAVWGQIDFLIISNYC